MPDHLWPDLDRRKLFPSVKMNRQPEHLGNDNHVPSVSLDRSLSFSPVLFLGLTNMLKQNPLIISETLDKRASLSCGQEFDEVVHRHLTQLVRRMPTIAELSRHTVT